MIKESNKYKLPIRNNFVNSNDVINYYSGGPEPEDRPCIHSAHTIASRNWIDE